MVKIDFSQADDYPRRFRPDYDRHSDFYIAYMASPEWAERRAEAIDDAGGCCEDCGDCDENLEVHHLTYVRLGYEEPEDLVAICHHCHEVRHSRRW